MTSEKYTIYDADLKYKKYRKLDPSQIEWGSEEQKRIYFEVNTDSVEYRIKECIEKHKGEMLDFSHMELIDIPIISINIMKNVKYLFLNNNNLTNTNGIGNYINLEVLDLDCNNIDELTDLPAKLVELNCSHNNIKNIPDMKNLMMLDCSDNMLEKLNTYEKMTTLSCSNNKIKSIPPLKKLKKLVCENNLVVSILDFPVLEYLNCGFNEIENIKNCPNIIDMLCRNNRLMDLPDCLLHLKYLEIYCNKLDVLKYYPNLKELYCDIDGISQLSKKYVIDKSQIYSNRKCFVLFK